jgi:predicted signal transduction protein with EAL and GGDEF domain
LLVEFAERLRTVVGDGVDIARFGGDEFLVTTTADNVDELTGFASRLRSSLSEPMSLGGVEIIVTTSIGAAFAPDGDPRPVTNDELLRDADLALHEAKRNGRDCLVIFTPDLLAREGYRVALAGDLRKARSNHEIEPYYQPIVDLFDGTICGAEALIRWNHPFEGVILPDRWLTVAEETGLLVGIGRATMEESCRRFAAINAHRPLAPVRVAVNLSATEVRSPGLVTHVAQVLSTSGLSPAQIIFEVSEQIVGDALTVAVLEELHALGVRLSIDDFGTGYASMGQLKRFPVDEIKIDQSFVAGLGVDAADTTIVRTIVELGTGLGLDVVAEGVTTESQAEQLAGLGCRYAQGWLYGRAQPFSRFVGLISRMDQERDDAGRDTSRASGADTFGADERLGA